MYWHRAFGARNRLNSSCGLVDLLCLHHTSPGNAETTKTSTCSSFDSFVMSPIHNWILLTPLEVVSDIVSWTISDILAKTVFTSHVHVPFRQLLSGEVVSSFLVRKAYWSHGLFKSAYLDTANHKARHNWWLLNDYSDDNLLHEVPVAYHGKNPASVSFSVRGQISKLAK